MPEYPTWEDALTYVLDGWPVIQVDRHSKRVSSNGWSSTANPITDPDYIRRRRSMIWPGCAPHGHNLAGVLGRAGVDGRCRIGLDVDPAEGGFETLERLVAQGVVPARTRRHRTPHGGEHPILWAPEGTRGGKLGDGVMVRGWGPRGGSYIVLPPSVLADGGQYEVADDHPEVESPAALLERLAGPPSSATDPPFLGVSFELEAEPVDLDGLPSHLATFLGDAPELGRRSDHVLRFTCNVLEYGYSAGQALHLAREYKPAIDKYGGRLDVEVRRILAKVAPRHQHPGAPCDRAGCPNRPSWMGGAS
jgi:hypothetical protein